ncbi:Plasma membrane proteolipid 3 [Cytospora mali]|nr:Plasma membrane proteolipid 3 [Valsa mali var. pyri (nom. inval.)]
MPFTGSDIFKIILAIILPPLGVFLERGCGADLLINILLTILGYIPGIIHALYVLASSDCPSSEQYDKEQG